MKRTDTVVIGGGQAGLAMSRCLADRAIDHVVLERGRVAERWRSERWDSLRLLTPNWQSRLPGFRYEGSDPDGYMTMPEVIRYLERYASSFAAPVESETTVRRVHYRAGLYRVETDRGIWEAPNVVVATGHADVPFVPEMASGLGPDVFQTVPTRYRNPEALPAGGVLVVGASASGIQLAEEIHASGRPVTLSVGRHTRLPRLYRGKDILWWFDVMGLFDETADDVFDFERSRSQPSMQLVGRPDRTSLDLGILSEQGVRLAGKTAAIAGGRVVFQDDLELTTSAADRKLARLLERIDAFAAREGVATDGGPARPLPVEPAAGPKTLDLRAEGIRSVVWATGFERRYEWLRVPVFEPSGEIFHHQGVTQAPGLYVLGLQFQRRRKSSFIDGVGDDARTIASHIDWRMAYRPRAVA